MNQTNGSESSPQPNPGTRRHELERLLDRLERTGTGDTGDYNAIAMLVADAALEADDDTLASGQLWLKRIYSRQLIGGDTSASISEHRGRTLALIDVVQWLLRRVTPQDVAAGLEAGGQPRRFLEFIAEQPGLTNQTLAELLRVDMTAVSRLGKRLRDGGLARRRKIGRSNYWEITPRGASALRLQPLVTGHLDRVRARRLAQHMIEVADVREKAGAPAKWLPIAGRVIATVLASPGPLSPTEVASRTNLSRNVVRAAAAFLIERGYLVQDGRPPDQFLPEPSLPLELDSDRYGAIGVKLLPDRVVAVMTDLTDLRTVAEHVVERPLADQDPQTVFDAIETAVGELRTPVPGYELPRYLIGLGVETGGHVDSRSGRVVFSPNLGWRGVDLADALEVATGLQTFVENDANALAVHEQLVGSAVGKNNFAAILLDDGIGAGLIIDGQLVHGTSGLAGELGHIVIRPGGPICRCGNTGCLESIASIRGILNAIGRETGTIPRSIEAADTLATQGDTAACRAFAAAGGAMGQAISIVQNMLNVERVLIAVPAVLDPSSESRASDLFQTSLVRATSEAAFSSAASDCTIDIHHFARSGEYGAQGAASIVVRQFVQAPLSWRPVATIENTEQEPFDEAAYAREFDADMGDLIAPLIDNTMRS